METKKIFYQSDFRLVETSDAGFGVPFKFTYYTARIPSANPTAEQNEKPNY